MLPSTNEPTMNLTMNLPFTPTMNLMNLICMYIRNRKVQSEKTLNSGFSLHFQEKRFKGSFTPNTGVI